MHDIPISDELLDILGFLAHELVYDHIEQGKHSARKRINQLKETELRASKLSTRETSEKGLQNKSAKEKINITNTKQIKKKKSTNQKRIDLAKKKREEEEEKKKELERMESSKIEEQNRHPDGPFSTPAGTNITHGMPVPIHCPADIDGPLELPDDPAIEHSKVDGTTAYASIASGYDVLLGDFEEAYHSARREGWDRVAPSRRKRRFVNLFR